MRTKTLLLAAAVIAAGITASQAQVYSVNAVGYVNMSLVNGYNLIGNPLNGTNNNINTVIPVAPADSVIQRWNPTTQRFYPNGDVYYVVPEDPTQNGWYDQDLNRSATVLNPGEAFFLFTPTATTLTFVGEVPQGNLTNRVANGYKFYSSIVPQSAGIKSMGFPGVADMTYSPWNAASQRYANGYVYYVVPEDHTQDGWYDQDLNPVDPTPAVGGGFLLFNPAPAMDWTRSFNVNN